MANGNGNSTANGPGIGTAGAGLEGLRDWQKDRAQAQQAAMRKWVGAVASIETLTGQIAGAERDRDAALVELDELGVSPELLGEWTGLDVAPTGRRPRRRPVTAAPTAAS